MIGIGIIIGLVLMTIIMPFLQLVIERVEELKKEAAENADKAIDSDPKKIDVDKVSNFWVGSENSYRRVLNILNAL